MSNNAPLEITISPVTHADVSTLSRIGFEACRDDRQTQLKMLGDVSYLSTRGNREALRESLRNPRHSCIKAVDAATGAIVGGATFGFARFDHADVPRGDPGPETGDADDVDEAMSLATATATAGAQQHSHGGSSSGGSNGGPGPAALAARERRARSAEAIRRLDAMQDTDMRRMQAVLLPDPSTRCVVVIGLAVDPRFHARGVGSRLLAWATARADAAGVFMWVPSSEAAWRVYRRAGFQVVKELSVDLDEWAPERREDGGDWGRYVVRYMRRPALWENADGVEDEAGEM